MLRLIRHAGVLVLLMAGTAAWAAGPATVEQILEQHRRHGYVSPKVAAAQLEQAVDRPADTASLSVRRRYYAAVAELGVLSGEGRVAEPALAKLEAMAEREACPSCRLSLLVRRAHIAASQRQFEEAHRLLEQVRRHGASEDAELALDIRSVQAFLHERAGEFEEAITAALAAADLAARLDRPAKQCDMLGVALQANLGRGDLDQAMVLAAETHALAERIGHRHAMALTRTNEAYVYSLREDYPNFRAALEDALRLSQDVPGLGDLRLTTLVNLSAYHVLVGEYPRAIEVAREAEAFAQEMEDPLSHAFAISNRGSAMARMGQVDEGLALMEQASERAEKAGHKRATVNLLNEKARVYERVGRPREAFRTLRRVVALNAEITDSEREQAVQEVQEQFAAERRTREIGRLSSERARLQATAEARAWRQRLWAAVAVACALAAILLSQGVRHLLSRYRTLEVDNAELSLQSERDPLTGAFNRRHCERMFAGYMQDMTAATRVGLVLLDVDFFKRINDTRGHAAGDAVLVEVTRRLQGLLRDEDAVVRWGGEEFLLVLPGTSADGQDAVARRVLDAISATPVTVEGSPIPVTVSAGCIVWPLFPGQSCDEAVHVADLALYESKRGGRRRATCVGRLSVGADHERLRSDLPAAAAAGDVELTTVIPGATEASAAQRLVAESWRSASPSSAIH